MGERTPAGNYQVKETGQMKLNLVEIINAIATLILVAVIAYFKYKSWKGEKKEAEAQELHGLDANPERCKDHEARLRGLEKDLAITNTTSALMAAKMVTIAEDVVEIKRIVMAKVE
jgi:hypothetical protein